MEYIRRWFWEREFQGIFNSYAVVQKEIDLFVFDYDDDYNCHRMSIDYRKKRYVEVIYDHLRGNGALDAIDIIMSILLDYESE